ncbi:uncharacterized protein TRIADDRAFT_52034 [Trichoplax adhaerens]|uniref:Programmed cell death protein 10 dimerisation domain-containing protein n=1 Tax=Trichoplax adhaerens TaxID=10228 RepID=B3RLK4_TRIAD|nr:hypothetical protein TRIADDRAFT_52034 [Trichoplax adhaerens]EDV28792.1 hypothetical protein TRIADDRAFT_52034 [Trichoplax adhaerens]|eukprot:XP_002107994.1 hypothetical protein TRIADDRAFT_52034 [Trichoplax adhaerens]
MTNGRIQLGSNMATSASKEQKVVASLALHGMVLPTIDELQQGQNTHGAKILRDAFVNIESQIPGITHQFLNAIIESDNSKTDLNFEQSMLRYAVTPCKEYQLDRPEKEFVRLSSRSTALKSILSRIPDDIGDRSKFLNTIKSIASAIKEMLDALNDVCKKHKDFKKVS